MAAWTLPLLVVESRYLLQIEVEQFEAKIPSFDILRRGKHDSSPASVTVTGRYSFADLLQTFQGQNDCRVVERKVVSETQVSFSTSSVIHEPS
jgi:hypothetical protein